MEPIVRVRVRERVLRSWGPSATSLTCKRKAKIYGYFLGAQWYSRCTASDAIACIGEL